MASKSFGLFLCLLVCSPLAHAWIAGKESMDINQQRLDAPIMKLINGLKDNLGDLGNIGDLVGDSEAQPHELKGFTATPVRYYGPVNNPHVIAICDSSVTGGNCLVFDINYGLCLLCNGQGIGLIINCSTNVCLNVPVGLTYPNNNIKDFIDSCDLQSIWNMSTNSVINQNMPGTTVLNLCVTVIGAIHVEKNQEMRANPTSALSITITLCCQILTLLSVNLLGILNLTCLNFIVLVGDLSCLIGVLQGIVDLLVTAGITLSVLINAGVLIVLELVLTAGDGCRGLVQVLLAIGLHFNLTVLLGVVLTDIVVFLRICVQLGGNVYTGLNGIVRIIACLVAFVNGAIALDACLQIIITVCVNISGVLSLSVTLNAIIQLINGQISQWGNAAGWGIILNLVVSLQNGTCSLVGVNISAIVSLCLGGIITTVLNLVVSIVIILSGFITTLYTNNHYWATLIRVIFFLLNTITGRIIINILCPTLGIVINLLNPCLNLLSGLLLTLVALLAALNLLGLVAAILLVPILTTIWNLVAAVISSLVGLNLSNCLDAVPSEKALITNWMPKVVCLGCC